MCVGKKEREEVTGNADRERKGRKNERENGEPPFTQVKLHSLKECASAQHDGFEVLVTLVFMCSLGNGKKKNNKKRINQL